jgi:hypothetical protein
VPFVSPPPTLHTWGLGWWGIVGRHTLILPMSFFRIRGKMYRSIVDCFQRP